MGLMYVNTNLQLLISLTTLVAFCGTCYIINESGCNIYQFFYLFLLSLLLLLLLLLLSFFFFFAVVIDSNGFYF